MYSKEEFDKTKTKVLKYIIYQKRSEYEVRNKFIKTIEENMLEDIIIYLKEAKYIDDFDFVFRTVNNIMYLKNLSIKEIKYKLTAKGIDKNIIEQYEEENYEELENYEKKSIYNLRIKKQNSLNDLEIKNYLLKKGYKLDNIKEVLENE